MPCIRTSPSSSPSASAAGAPVVRKITFGQYCARGPIKPKVRKAGSAVTKESNTTATATTTMAATKSSRSPASSSGPRAPVNRKITFDEYLARGTIKPRKPPSSAGSKESTSTSTTAAAPPSPACSFSLSPASSPPASPSPAPSRQPPADVRRDTSWTIPVETRDTKLPGNPLVTKNVRVVNPLMRPKPKPKSKSAAATPSSPPATRSPSPVAARQPSPSDDEFDYLFNEPSDEDKFDDLFNEPPPPKAVVQDAKEARREAALARSAKITTGAIARAGNNPMANTRARLNRIDKSATSKSARNSGKISRGRGGAGGARKSKSKLRNLAGTSGRWVEPQTPLEAEEAARRAAEMEEYRREVDRLLAEAPRNNRGGCVAVLGDSRMSTVGFGNNLRERRPEENPMWTTNAAVLRGQGGLKY
ncbi:uncharacterized protein J3D65DRAFT_299948 [Phyllosticta citribraziliensis]|uniref:Uncharacterized protein n=1 Tax=Phyllosticta citribraziliensis TaxID=989973 RepID=A0ABR1LXC9_9PEZI